MKISAEKRLFWFFKDGVELNIKDQRYLDMYVQQVLSHGRTSDIKKLMKEVDLESLKKSLERIKGYLPKRVRNFWEDMLGDTR